MTNTALGASYIAHEKIYYRARRIIPLEEEEQDVKNQTNGYSG